MGERMAMIVEHSGLNVKQFEDTIGSGRGAIRTIIEGGGGISNKTIEKIFLKFPVYNFDWLLTGRGEMLLTVESKPHNLSRPFAQNSIVTVDTSDNVIVPIVDPRAAAGAAFIYNEPDYIKDYHTFSFPGSFLRSGSYASFPVKGDSMFPTIKQGDYVIAREIESISNLRNGEVYVIVYHEDHLLHFFVKRGYYFLGELNIILRSDNDDYPDESIEVQSVTKLYHVEACYTTQFARIDYNRGRFDRIEKRMDRLEKQIVKI